jgi:hypothetical protein
MPSANACSGIGRRDVVEVRRRERISDAQKARWAKQGGQPKAEMSSAIEATDTAKGRRAAKRRGQSAAKRGPRKMSAAARKRISQAAKKRWAAKSASQ